MILRGEDQVLIKNKRNDMRKGEDQEIIIEDRISRRERIRSLYRIGDRPDIKKGEDQEIK